jgi:hypothetical protein
MADLMHIDKRVSEIISFAMRIKFGSSGTVAQAIPYCEAGLGDLAFELIDLCGRNRNFFSTATFRTAACILALAGHDKDYVFEQYRALVTHDWDEMSEIAKALWKRVDSNAYSSTDRYVLMALGLKVFDINKADNKRISVNEQDVENVGVYVRRVLDMALENYRLKNSMAL